MKRFHVHLTVDDLAHNVRFYSALFGVAPSVEKSDYAKWLLDDPRLNFAISARGAAPGVNHLGIQVDSDDELADLRRRVDAAEIAVTEQNGTACCYAKSDKYWAQDPQGLAWETFHTLGEVPVFGDGDRGGGEPSACCVPEAVGPVASSASGCCAPPAAPATKTSCCG